MTVVKQPNEICDWTHNWDDGWLASGETISTSGWVASPSGITIDSDSETTLLASVFLSSGIHGVLYKLKNTITTNQGRTGIRTLLVKVWKPLT